MPATVTKTILVILVCAACTFVERGLPFALLRKGNIPNWVHYLGKVLPVAIMATLVVYCLRATAFTSIGGFLPQTVAVTVTAVLHLWRHNTLLSVFGGTAVYMCFIQLICG